LDRLSDYAYNLPEQLIAQTPLEDRAASRLMLLHRDGRVEHRMFSDVPNLLKPGDLLVMNDTRVSAVRLMGRKTTGASVEALLIRNLDAFRYEALVKPGKRLKLGTRIEFDGSLGAVVGDDLGDGLKVLNFDACGDFNQRLDSVGQVPLPPYIHTVLADRERYQTVYGVSAGSAAAPTAGLHFTESMLDRIQTGGVEIARVTLHVGIDTFRPVQVEDLGKHHMHGEMCEISPDAAAKINEVKGRIIAVGTTTVRTLESFAKGPREVGSGIQDTRLFIRPGFRFNIVDGMFTNFHLPGTTMLVMISALVGRDVLMNAYSQAVAAEYRFLSFGDSMLVV
jgi:S-adenosylmethionine:tRNA ribosyltransferase-isomerase